MNLLDIAKAEVQEKTFSEMDRAWVAKAFLNSVAGGDEYKILFDFTDLPSAKGFCDVLASFEIFPKLREKKSGAGVTIKSKECFCNLLALVGATRSLMQLNNDIAKRELVASANRRTNCDTANIQKQIDAASAQVDVIRKMQSDGSFDTLPAKLRATAAARLAHPNASLSELASILGITKSGLVNRLRKILQQG